jgi:hypothetical protein
MLMQSSEGHSCGEEGGGATLQAPDSKGQENNFFFVKIFDCMCSTIFKPLRHNNMRFTYKNYYFFKDQNFCLGMAIVITRPGCHKPSKVTAGTRIYIYNCALEG